MTTDVEHISEHTGIDRSVIERMKKFLFLEEHDLEENQSFNDSSYFD